MGLFHPLRTAFRGIVGGAGLLCGGYWYKSGDHLALLVAIGCAVLLVASVVVAKHLRRLAIIGAIAGVVYGISAGILVFVVGLGLVHYFKRSRVEAP
jgi:hypothetical protein